MIMTDRTAYYHISPRIVLSGKRSKIKITPRGEHASFLRAKKLQMSLYPVSGLNSEGVYSDQPEKNMTWKILADGSAEVEALFAGEQEYTLLVSAEEFGCPEGAKQNVEMYLGFYCVKEDLYGMLPLRGDLHTHSECSDGELAPECLAARGRELGLDFLAVTDHGKYPPSLRAIDRFSASGSGILLFPGEEVQLPRTPVHIVNFGGSASINELAEKNPNQYVKEVEALLKEMKHLTPGQNPFPAGAASWAFHKIRECGGAGIFCHCFWQKHRYMISEALTHDILAQHDFDAVEMVSGHGIVNFWSNNLQTALMEETVLRKPGFSVVGASDSHYAFTPNEFGCVYTILWTPEISRKAIINAIRRGQCVAAEEQTGAVPRFYGSFRFVRLAAFLRKHYFPHHDALCTAEGILLQEYFSGNHSLAPAIQSTASAVEQYRKSLFH